MYGKILRKILLKIPGVTAEEADMVVDGIIRENEINFREAIKDMATKADVKDMATKADIKDMATKADIKDMATKADIKDMATKSYVRDAIKNMATKTDLAELKVEMHRINNRTIMWMVGIGLTVIVCNIGSVMALALKLLGV